MENIRIIDNQIKDKLELTYSISVLTYDDENKITIWVNDTNKMNTIQLPKTKELTYKYLGGRVESVLNSSFKNLKPIFEKLNIKGNIYYTSFGFSYDCFMKSEKILDQETKEIKLTLDNMGIKYTNEYSDAYWVYRFKVSKSVKNLELITKLNN